MAWRFPYNADPVLMGKLLLNSNSSRDSFHIFVGVLETELRKAPRVHMERLGFAGVLDLCHRTERNQRGLIQ